MRLPIATVGTLCPKLHFTVLHGKVFLLLTGVSLYAIILPALTIFLFFGCCCIISLIYDSFSIPDDFAVALGQALLFLFLVATVAICIIIPYIQTLLVLLLKRFVKDK